MSLREAYAISLYAGLGDEPDRTRPIDYIRGMGFSEALGRYLHRLRAQDPSAYKPVVQIMRWRLAKLNERERLVPFRLIQAVVEAQVRCWLSDLCPICSGRGKRAVERFNSLSEQKKDEDCLRCGGVGRIGGRWHDFQEWGKVAPRKAEAFWEWGWEMILRAERKAHGTVCRQVRT